MAGEEGLLRKLRRPSISQIILLLQIHRIGPKMTLRERASGATLEICLKASC